MSPLMLKWHGVTLKSPVSSLENSYKKFSHRYFLQEYQRSYS